ncbi:MAG TPA: ATP-binding protein [Gammaproteobacteria bacterium]
MNNKIQKGISILARIFSPGTVKFVFFLFALNIAQSLFASDFPDPVFTFKNAAFIDTQIDFPPAVTDSGWRQVNLPVNWYESHRSDAYPSWFRMDFNVDKGNVKESWGIYLPAVNTNAVVWLNDERIGDGGRMRDPAARNWHRPLYFGIPKNLLHQGQNSLYVQFLPKKSGFGFLGEIYIGPENMLKTVFERHSLFKQTFIGISTVLLIGFGSFISLLWFKRRKDSLYGWFAAASFSWAFFVFDMYVQHVPVQERLWDTMVFATVGWLVIFMTIFFFRFWNLSYPRYERFLLIFGLTGTVTLYLVGDKYFYYVSSFVWDNVLIIFSMYMAWFIITQCMKWPSTEAWLLTMALLVVVAFGGHDDLVQMGVLDLDRMHLLPYGAPFLLGVVVWMLVQRFTNALDETEKLNLELDKRVQLKTFELEQNYMHIKRIEREKILAQERERIMRDMHDGTGGHLVSALAQVETGDVNKSVLIETLQSALDDIRLMIDSLDPVDEDVVSVLAMLRSRLESRLHYSGIKVKWMVQDVPVIPGLGPEKVLQLMHILYESVTNIIKHAKADVITFRTGVIALGQGKQHIFIEIQDNGKGFPDDYDEGHGLVNMYYRASIIGARLDIENHENGAIVRILLPMSFKSDAGV